MKHGEASWSLEVSHLGNGSLGDNDGKETAIFGSDVVGAGTLG